MNPLTGAITFMHFYPRPPRGGRPKAYADSLQINHISIHALREEGDVRSSSLSCISTRFLSTPSARRATYSLPVQVLELTLFLSTPSARRATSFLPETY